MLGLKTLAVLAVAGLSLAGVGGVAGCNSYATPGRAADFSKIGLTEQDVKAMTDTSVREVLAKKPMLVFPTAIAVVRVQAENYHYSRSHGMEVESYGHGAYSVVTTRDVETDGDFARIEKLPQVLGVAPLKRLLLSSDLQSDLQLRTAAAKVHAGLLLYYTFDTRFYTDEHLAPISVFTLGIAPNHEAHVNSTASAVLMDVNNGYVYGVYEASSKGEQIANAWTSGEAMDQIRAKAEREAFEKLIGEFTTGWTNVVVENQAKGK